MIRGITKTILVTNVSFLGTKIKLLEEERFLGIKMKSLGIREVSRDKKTFLVMKIKFLGMKLKSLYG